MKFKLAYDTKNIITSLCVCVALAALSWKLVKEFEKRTGTEIDR